jgi:hypothetical protein
MRLVVLALIASTLASAAACTVDDRDPDRDARPAERSQTEGTAAPVRSGAKARPCADVRGRPPCGPGAELGVEYPLVVWTRCGVRFTRFDGRLWRAVPALVEGERPPAAWDDRPEVGAMTLVSPAVARFRSKRGGVARFAPADPIRVASCA